MCRMLVLPRQLHPRQRNATLRSYACSAQTLIPTCYPRALPAVCQIPLCDVVWAALRDHWHCLKRQLDVVDLVVLKCCKITAGWCSAGASARLKCLCAQGRARGVYGTSLKPFWLPFDRKLLARSHEEVIACRKVSPHAHNEGSEVVQMALMCKSQFTTSAIGLD
jgi:hypothetical protein